MSDFVSSFSGLATSDIEASKAFYTDMLGLLLVDESMGLRFELPGGGELFVYEKTDHQPATFTVLNFVVEDIDASVAGLQSKGITFLQYDFGNGAKTDETGVMRGRSVNRGPDIAWFTDPGKNILSILQN